MPDEMVHNWEPFLKSGTFSKKVRELHPETSVVASRFANLFFLTLFVMVSFPQMVPNCGPFCGLLCFAVLLHKRPKFNNMFRKSLQPPI